MLLFISLSALGIATAITFLIMPCIASPTYASMIFIEFFMSLHEKKVPEFFRFRQPSDGFSRYWMDLIASITTIIGGMYVWILNSYLTHHQEGKFWKLFFSNEILHPILPFIFCSCLFTLYFINSRNNEDNRDPMTKFKELCKLPSVPFFLHK